MVEEVNEMESIVEFSENIEDAEAPSPIPHGDYAAEIRNVVRAESKNTGNRYADITFIIPADQFPADWEDAAEYPEGLPIHYRRVMLEDNKRARYNFKRFCENVGASVAGKQVDLTAFLGCQATVTIDHQPDLQGLPRAEIVAVKAVD